jgi:hypothetical protein
MVVLPKSLLTRLGFAMNDQTRGYEIYTEAQQFNSPLVAVQAKNYPGKLLSRSFVDLRHSELATVANSMYI